MDYPQLTESHIDVYVNDAGERKTVTQKNVATYLQKMQLNKMGYGQYFIQNNLYTITQYICLGNDISLTHKRCQLQIFSHVRGDLVRSFFENYLIDFTIFTGTL
ncbi:hypothetical protein CSKR_201344 [Clonorchis sinensis]|uniref:Uncharacterized protein n=1 Tax=Clonorchis sinensis TaxID=79923 RepID=A0A8T1MQB7_CLOSI|nr:hypothetical protein CSKR_201344 [Clonorchis sinensis]